MGRLGSREPLAHIIARLDVLQVLTVYVITGSEVYKTGISQTRVMQVKVANIPGKKVEHQGIKVQLLGQIELASERGHPHTFISLGSYLDTCAVL